jgi:hypothetical protein
VIAMNGAVTLERAAPDRAFVGQGVYMLLDIVGFSRLCETLTREAGRRGANRVSNAVVGALSPIVDALEKAGGHAVDMVGDSLHVLWTAESAAALAAARAAALSTADALLRAHGRGAALALRVGVGVGGVAVAGGGGPDDPVLFGGEAKLGALAALARAKPGERRVEEARPAFEAARSAQTWTPWTTMPRLLPEAAAWDGETRVATVMSIEVSAPGARLVCEPADALPRLGRILAAVAPYADAVQTPHLDEKGLTLIALFGMGARGVATAAQAEAAARAAVAAPPSIGVATGRVFAATGRRDGAQRGLYNGAPMVLATRLMQAAARATLLDRPTAEALAAAGLTVGAGLRRTVKGVAEPVECFPLPGGAAEAAARAEVARPASALIDRDRESARIEAFLRGEGPAGALVVEGGPGMGKSALIDHAAARAPRPPIRVRPVPGDPHGTAALVSAALGLPAGASDEDAAAAVAAVVAHGGPLLVDDAHWLDERSQQIVRRAVRTSPRLRVVLSVERADAAEVGAWLRSLLPRPDAVLRLDPLGLDATRALLTRRFGVDATDAAELAAFHAMCGGAPGAVLELGERWRETLRRNAVRSSDRALRADRDEIDLPLTLSQSIERRVGRLEHGHRRLLQIVSALGHAFDVATVGRLRLAPPEALSGFVESAEREGLIVRAGDGSRDRYAFRTDAIWNVVYGMLAEDRARTVHRTLARSIAAGSPPSPARDSALALHLGRAGAHRAAARYLARSGDHALATGAPGAALRAFEAAIAAADAAAAGTGGRPFAGPLRRAAWRENAARAALALGDLPRSLDHCTQGLRALGLGAGTRLGRAARLLASVARLAATRVAAAPARGDAAAGLALRRGRLFALRTDALYFAGDTAGMLASAIQAVDHLDRAGAPAVAARPVATLAYAAGAMRLTGFADRLIERRLARCDDHAARAYLVGTRSLIAFTRGDIPAAQAAAHAAAEAAERSGDAYLIGLVRTILGLELHHGGDYAAARRVFGLLERDARLQGNDQHTAWALYAGVAAELCVGAAPDAGRRLDEARELVRLISDEHSALNIEAIGAAYALAAGAADEALRLARLTAARARRAPTNNFGSFEGFFGAPEVLLRLALTSPDRDRAALASEAAAALGAAARFARIYAYATPRLLQHRGALALARGRAAQAARSFEASARLARRMGLPGEARRAAALGALLRPDLAGADPAARAPADADPRCGLAGLRRADVPGIERIRT